MKLSQQIPAINVLNETTKPAVTPAPVVMTPEQLQKLSEIKTRAGWLSPSEVTSLAKGNATTEAIDAVATMKAKQIIDDQGSDQPEGNWARRNVYDKLKATTRYTFAGLNFVPEFVQGGIAQFFDDNKDVDGAIISTTLGSLLENPELQGEGFFPGDKLMEKQAERARRYRGTVNGSAWTVGRGAANLVFKPKSLPYNIMSGVLDAAVMIRFDPVLPATKAAKILTAGPNKVPRLSVAALKALREELATGVGLTKGLAEYGLDGTLYDTFSRTNRRFVTLIDRLVGEKSASRIAEDIFDHKLPNEVVNALAGAKDPEVVRAILATGWGISDQALPQDIRNIQKTLFGSRTIMGTAIGDIVHERMPLVDGIRKSRYFTTMAKGTIIVAGDTNDNRKAVKTIISYLRTAGVDADTVDEIASMAVKNFVPSGSDAVRKATMEVFEGTLKSVMKQDGIKDEVINELFTRARSGVEKARIYLQDRAGNATDNGYHTWLMNQDRGLIPEQQLELMLSELGYRGTNELAITSPTELVEMLDRVQVLPDLRDVRRITRSKLFRDVLGKQDKVGKRAITAKKVRQDITFVTDQKEFDRLGKELDSLMLKPQKTKNMLDQISELKKQRNDLKIVRNVKVVTAEEKGALNAIDYVQNQLWKPLALASGGYVVRNSLDAQIRMAFSELPSLLTHPMQYISLVTGTSKKMSLKFENLAALGTKANQKTISKLGQQINELRAITVRTSKQEAKLAKLVAKQDEMLLTNEGLLDEALQDLAQELGFGLDKQGLGALDIEDNMIKTGHFSNVSRGSAEGATRHTDAVSQNGYRTFGDPLRRMAAQTFAEFGGVSQTSRDAAASRIVNLIRSNPELQDNVFAMHRKGFQITESGFGRTTTTGAIDLAALPEDEMVQALYQYAQRISVENAQTLTGGVYEIQFMYAFNRVPKTIGKTTVPTFETGLKTIKDADGKEISVLKTLVNTEDGKLRVGSIVEISTDEVGVVTGFKNSVSREIIIDPYTGGVIESGVSQKADIAIIQPIENADAFGKGNGTVFARRIIENTPIWDGKRGLPQTLKRELSQFEVKDKGELNAFQKTMDGSTDWFFGRVVGTITRKLERSPVFREYYYQEVNALVDRLDPAEAQKFLTQVTEYATEAGMTPEKYVGDKQIIARMRNIIAKNEAAPTGINPALVKQEGILFHGTPQALPNGQFSDIFSVSAPDANNLFGRGIYLTDNPDVGIAYTVKGAKNKKSIVDGKTVNKEGFVYKVKITNKENFIDLRKPAPKLNEILWSQISDEAISFLEKYSPSYTDEGLQKFISLLNDEKATGEVVFSSFKKLFAGMETSEVDSVIQEVTLALREVADGVIYQGGVRRGGLGEHTAYVVLNDKALNVVEELSPMAKSVVAGGDVTINELDEFAKVQAVGKMKELLYDASERSNLQDALRIIMPFAPAWKEIIGTYAGFFKSNPIGAARSFQRIYTGIGNADPDNDGRGFFYKDPTTGQQMFTFPGSGTLAKALTGLDATIEAPVNRLSQGIQAFPALGPMAQIAVSTWMPDVPETDAMVGILLPYGRKGPEALLPLGYLQKLKSAWTSDEDDVTSIYFNTYAETLRALSATGDYDLSSKDGVLQLEKDAKFKARILTTFRAVSQFTGPTSGTIEFKVPTNEGDQFISALIKEFYDMQADPAIGYDKAVPQFLAKYGDEVALYVSSKSRAAVEGLEATSEFNDWERRNGDLISLYPEVSRYLAPAGSDFNFTVYDRQTRAGERVKLTDDQIIELAQVRIGSANFRAARQQVGPYPSDEAKDLLKRYRAFLSKKYPGFPAVAEFQVGKYYNDILELKQLVFDKRVTVDGTVTAIRQYLLAREQAIAASGVSESGFRSAKSAEPLRDKLASIGLVLSESEPNFARIYDRLLASEVE